MFLLELDSDFQPLKSDDAGSDVKTCHKCGKGLLKQRAEMRFVHFYQFPIFPLVPKKQTYCNRCHKVFKREPLAQNVFSAWHIAAKFIGFVMLMLLAVNQWQSYQDGKVKELEILQAPAKFDVWIINETKQFNEQEQNDRFKIIQVFNVTDTSATVKVGQVLYPSVNNAIKAIRLDNLLIYNYFSNKTESFDRAELIKLKQQSVIVSAYRPQNLSLFGGIVMRQPTPKPFKPTHKPNPQNQEAIRMFQEGQFKEAAGLFDQAAKQGSAWAQYNLADMYLTGQGVELDLAKAEHYLKQAAEQGLTEAKIALANLNEANL